MNLQDSQTPPPQSLCLQKGPAPQNRNHTPLQEAARGAWGLVQLKLSSWKRCTRTPLATNLLTGVQSGQDFRAGGEDRSVDVLFSNQPKELQFHNPSEGVNFHGTVSERESCCGAEEVSRVTWCWAPFLSVVRNPDPKLQGSKESPFLP